MPKRTRCPHCDRLFGRDVIDGHILKCRMKEQEKSISDQTSKRKDVIVDGNNVAYSLTPGGKPRLSNILLALRSLRHAGFRPVIVVSSALKHDIDKPDEFMELISTKEVIEAPRGTNDDLHIIRMAQKTNSDIITNDRFLDWRERHPWLDDRLREYRMTPSGMILI